MILVMENLPFLTKPNEPSRNDRAPPSENEWPVRQEMLEQQPRYIEVPAKPDVFESIRANPMALILIGIIVGVIIANMRPVVIQPK